MLFNGYNLQSLGLGGDFKKRVVEEGEKNIFRIIQNFYEENKEDFGIPTQIIFGRNVWEKALKDKIFMKYFQPQNNVQLQKSGLAGYLTNVQILTDYYKDEYSNCGWNIGENSIVFNAGSPLKGDL